MHARWLGLLAALAAAPLLSGCAASPSADVAEATGGDLSVYSSLPLQGPQAPLAEQLVGGEKLALYEAGGRAGAYKVAFDSLDDAEPKSGSWNDGVTSTNAKLAAQDTSTIAYLGELDSAATAVSLPLINGAGILQISAASPYVGLTSSLDAGQDEPERFYPSGKRTFARLQPGDPVEAAAMVQLLRSLGVHSVYVLADEEGASSDAFQLPLTELLASDAQHAGIAIAANESIGTSAGAVYSEAIRKIIASGAQAVFISSEGGAGVVALWRQLHSADSHLKLLGSSTMATEAFSSQLGAAATASYLATPLLATDMYPRAAQHVLSAYRKTFGRQAGPEALYGYEAMNLVLDAIRAAGSHGDDRDTITERVLHTRDRDSVIGSYSIEASGETTLRRYAVDSVVDGRPVFLRAFSVSAAEVSP